MEAIIQAQKELKGMIRNEAQWVKQTCLALVAEAAAPNVWDDIIYEKIVDPKHFRSTRIANKCDEGYYQRLAEIAYSKIDINELLNEADKLKEDK